VDGWTGKTVNAGDSMTVTFIVTVDSSVPGGTDIVNADYGATCAEGTGASGSPVTTSVLNPVVPEVKIFLPFVMRNY